MNKTVRACCVAVALVSLVPSVMASEGRKVKKSPLDHVLLYEDKIPKDVPIRIREFPTDKADLGTGANKNKPKYQALAQEMKESAFQLLLPAVIQGLEEKGFEDVEFADENAAIPDGALVIQGEFTKLNPGSRGKRYGMGFGAGKSQVCASGQVLRGVEGEILMQFDHCRSQAIGLFGGDSKNQMTKDSGATGSHLAAFMGKWAEGEYLP